MSARDGQLIQSTVSPYKLQVFSCCCCFLETINAKSATTDKPSRAADNNARRRAPPSSVRLRAQQVASHRHTLAGRHVLSVGMGKRSAPAAYSPVAVGVTTTQQHQPPPSQLQQKRQATASDHEPATTSTLVPLDRRQANLASFSRGYHDRERRHHNEYAYDDDEDEDDVDYDDDEKNRDVVASPPRKTHRVQLHHQQPSAMIGSGADAGANRRSRLLNARAYTAGTVSTL